MMLHVPAVLTADGLRDVRAALDEAQWTDGRVTAGSQSVSAKHNDQVREGDPAGMRAGEQIFAALERHPLFISAALPLTVYPPLFNRYGPGQAFGEHVDNAIRQPLRGPRVRTDLSATLFLNAPDAYGGGELVIDAFGTSHGVKLPAGDMIVYSATSVHRVNAVTSGVRLASFFWIQSMIRDDGRRAILLELDASIRSVRDANPGQPALVPLLNVYHNLVRRWADC